MSWDVMVFNVGGDPKPLEQMDDYPPLPMGTPAEVRESIDAYLPGVDWSNPRWGLYIGDGFSFEFNMTDEAQETGFMVHVRGSGDAIGDLLKFAVPNRWSLLDCSTSEWINPQNPSQQGWAGFQAYRDKIIRQDETPDAE
ncbi:MAG TPA: hypothetical protein VHB77_13485 [Planctomycetaceae bacterium]|nr:hypothetical protein [Planctomycetaceae bacterium]